MWKKTLTSDVAEDCPEAVCPGRRVSTGDLGWEHEHRYGPDAD